MTTSSNSISITGVDVEELGLTGRPKDRCEQPSNEKRQKSMPFRPKCVAYNSNATAAQTGSSMTTEGHADVKRSVFR